ncbi:hypothetical protein ZIOFF_071067 [Zingiber officinale]|uniref:Uncharacterized protein n=1 Tax=Zingiber officinale TaxID=94328 RepID=A0A8J5C0L0_ZINOF|nr:hypothetical protein ZIOFF_071067 [Zingiber officinale]
MFRSRGNCRVLRFGRDSDFIYAGRELYQLYVIGGAINSGQSLELEFSPTTDLLLRVVDRSRAFKSFLWSRFVVPRMFRSRGNCRVLRFGRDSDFIYAGRELYQLYVIGGAINSGEWLALINV